ncbi:hypothetical protein FB451DRAFT_1572278 [Mycena latifolia]|nr:hypothetical protein FB451DRAFT_1572278 [Mycena latifolia]
MCVPQLIPRLFGHRCWQYNPDLTAIFPLEEVRYALDDYLFSFLASIHSAPTVIKPHVSSVVYGRTRGPNAYPFLLVYLRHPDLDDWPIRLKLQGFDGPLTVQEGRVWPRYDTAEECSTCTLAEVHQGVRELVGTWRYTVCHTMTFRGLGPGIADLLALAQVSTERDRTRAGYPATLFLALKTLFNGVVASGAKRRGGAAPLFSDVVEEANHAVIERFAAQRQCIQHEINMRRGLWSLDELQRQTQPQGSDTSSLEEESRGSSV